LKLTLKFFNYIYLFRWGILEVETFPNFPAEMQAYAAGLVEGI